MRVSDDIRISENVDRDRVARLEDRIARIEAHLGLRSDLSAAAKTPPVVLAPVFTEGAPRREELEFEVGQHWFAVAGVATLTAGLAFLLSMPYSGMPAIAPGAAGFGLAAGLFIAARFCPRTFPGGSGSLQAAAMVLFGVSALRLFFCGNHPAMALNSPLAHGILIAASVVNVTIAWERSSVWLTGLSLAIACVIGIASGLTSLILPTVVAVAAVTMAATWTKAWRGLLLTGTFLTFATYFIWAIGNPIRAGAVQFVREPTWAPAILLVALTLLGIGPLLRPRRGEDVPTNIAAFVNCAFGYGAFLVHTAAAFPAQFATLHLVMAVTLLGVAVAFYARTESRVSTFLYAMSGYAALTMAIIKLTVSPDVFVWLSVQSVVVVATAIWFRSRFIVVANFLIFAGIVVTYMVVTEHERGGSLGFGVVAIITAWVLSWKQHRLELKTGFMRNAYLASAFVIFPYSAYHVVPARYVTLAWITLAAAYYLGNGIVRSDKCRWMGHGTLVLTTIYVVGAGVSRFEPVYRVLSFLALGAALLTVSLLFARARRRQQAGGTKLATSTTLSAKMRL